MNRRRFLVTSLAGALAAPTASEAQQLGKLYRIGFLTTSPRSAGEPLLDIFELFTDFYRAFLAISRERVAGLTALADPLFIRQSKRIAELALRTRLPTAFARRENVEAGGLVSYGVNLADQFRRAAAYVVRIFNGASPGDLPVAQPSKLELVINLKTAKALGLTIPESLLLRADVVIE